MTQPGTLLIRPVQAGGYVVSIGDEKPGLLGTDFAFTDVDDLMTQVRSLIVTGDVVKPAPSQPPEITIRRPSRRFEDTQPVPAHSQEYPAALPIEVDP